MDNLQRIHNKNKSIYVCKYSDTLELDIQTPNEQRIIDQHKVADIVMYQIDYLKRNGACNFLGVVNIHFCKEDGKYYLVDGQHRIASLRQLFQVHAHDVDFFMEIVTVNTREELKHNYNIINKNTPLPEFSEMIDKSIPETVALYFQNKYPLVWSQSARPHRPQIFFNFFQETIGIIVQHMPDVSSNKLIEYMEQYNADVLSTLPFTSFQGVSEKMWIKAKEYGLYYGLFAYCTNDKYGYGWSKRIIEHYTNTKLKGAKIKKKQTIPASVKNGSWDKYVGAHIGEALCIVCNMNKINSKCFDAGHIVSEHNGGKVNLDNILPICHPCNLSMSTMNMDEYVAKHYPKHINRFKDRNYLQTIQPEIVEKEQQKQSIFGGFLQLIK